MQQVIYESVAKIIKETKTLDQNKAVAIYLQAIADKHRITYFQVVPTVGVYTLIEVEEPGLSPAETLEALS